MLPPKLLELDRAKNTQTHRDIPDRNDGNRSAALGFGVRRDRSGNRGGHPRVDLYGRGTSLFTRTAVVDYLHRRENCKQPKKLAIILRVELL